MTHSPSLRIQQSYQIRVCCLFISYLPQNIHHSWLAPTLPGSLYPSPQAAWASPPCLRKGKSPPHFQYFRITFQLHLLTLFYSNSSSWVGMVEVLFSSFLLIFKMITSILFQCIKKGSCKIILVLIKKDSSGEYLARSK